LHQLVVLFSLAALASTFSEQQGLRVPISSRTTQTKTNVYSDNDNDSDNDTNTNTNTNNAKAQPHTPRFPTMGTPDMVIEESDYVVDLGDCFPGSPSPGQLNQRHSRSNSICESIDSFDSNPALHRRRTVYLIRHGEAAHNVLEKIAQAKAREEAVAMNLSPEETHERMETARQSVLQDASLRDAPLTELGRQQAKETSRKLRDLIRNKVVHHPTEAMCSPLSRCLDTCKILLEDKDLNLKTYIRPEIAERRTLYPPDKPRPKEHLLRCAQQDTRFSIRNLHQIPDEAIADEELVRESKEMLRERASEMFDLLMECNHRHVLVVSHKGFLRELERGLLEMPESPLFDNCELRVYRVVFTMGERRLHQIERLA